MDPVEYIKVSGYRHHKGLSKDQGRNKKKSKLEMRLVAFLVTGVDALNHTNANIATIN